MALTATGLIGSLLVGVVSPVSMPIRIADARLLNFDGLVPPPADFVPENVVPPLLSVEDDLAAPYTDGCHLSYLAVEPRSGGCTYGRVDASKTVALIGDSHAVQWFPALERDAMQGDWQLTTMTKSSCPTVDLPVRSSQLGRDYYECAKWRENVLTRIRNIRPSIVVLGNYTASYASLVEGDGDFLAEWQRGLRSFIEQLPPTSRVIVVGDGPTWPMKPVDCLATHVDAALTCAMQRQLLLSDPTLRAERDGAVAAGARYVDTADWLCREKCYAMAGNVVLYRDRHHLTASGAALLTTNFEVVLQI